MEVCGEDDEIETGDGLDETSWVMMRLYACRRRGFVSEAGEIEGDRYLGYCVDGSTDCEDPFVYARYDLADAGSHPRLLPEICDIFTAFTYNYAGLLCRYERSKGEDVVGGCWGWGTGCWGRRISVWHAPKKRKGLPVL